MPGSLGSPGKRDGSTLTYWYDFLNRNTDKIVPGSTTHTRDVYYSYDPNQTRLQRSGPEDTFNYEFGEFNQLGVNLTLQAKF